MPENPFAVGDYAGAGTPSAANDPNQHPLMNQLIHLLSETRPWVRLVGVMVMIAAIFMIIGGIFMLVAGATGQGSLGMMGAIYIVMSFIYVYPALCLNRYASAISAAESTADMTNVVEAILQQKKFWRFCGIFTAIILAVYLIIAVFAVLAAVMR